MATKKSPVAASGSSLGSVSPSSSNSSSTTNGDRPFDYSKKTQDVFDPPTFDGMTLYNSVEYWFVRWWWKIHVDNTLANHERRLDDHEKRIQRLEGMAHYH